MGLVWSFSKVVQSRHVCRMRSTRRHRRHVMAALNERHLQIQQASRAITEVERVIDTINSETDTIDPELTTTEEVRSQIDNIINDIWSHVEAMGVEQYWQAAPASLTERDFAI